MNLPRHQHRKAANRVTRRRMNLPVKKKVLIVGEGRETEYNYFERLKREDSINQRFVVVVRRGKGFSAEVSVDHAINIMKEARGKSDPFDGAFCVIDVEGSNARATDIQNAKKKAQSMGIRLFFSNPSFEVWLLAHFCRTCRTFKDCDAVVAELSKHGPWAAGRPYDKSERDLYDALSPHTDTAIQNARLVREKDQHNGPVEQCNSSTEVDLLVTYLLGR